MKNDFRGTTSDTTTRPWESAGTNDFRRDLTNLLSVHDLDLEFSTPSHILSRFIIGCLKNFDEASAQRDNWLDDEENGNHTVDSPLSPSGLLGPVTLGQGFVQSAILEVIPGRYVFGALKDKNRKIRSFRYGSLGDRMSDIYNIQHNLMPGSTLLSAATEQL